MKISSKIFLQLSFITGLIVIIWYKTINQGLWGDGFYWFNPNIPDVHILPINLNFTYYNLLSRNIFKIIMPIFRDNQKAYQILQIFFLIILTAAIYFVVLKLTKKTVIAFSSCVLFISNSGGMYEMMAEGNLNRFLERVPNLILVIIGIYFLFIFLETKKIKYLAISWILFAVGIYLGQFASFVLPFYTFLSVIYTFEIKNPIKSLIVGILIASLFLISNFMIIRNSDQRSGYKISYYLNPDQKFIEKTFLMTTPLIIPHEIVTKIPGGVYPYVHMVELYSLILVILGILIGIHLYKKDVYLFKLYLACVLTMLTGTALMIYTDPIKYDPFKNFQAGRQVFIQSIFYSIALSSIIYVYFSKQKKVYLTILFAFLTIFVVYNTNISWQQISENQYLYQANKEFFSYIKSLYPKFNSDTVVVVGTKLIASGNFINDFNSPPIVTFISAPEDIQRFATKENKNNTFVIDVNYNPTPDGFYTPERVKVDDFTTLYRTTDLDLISTWGTKKVTWFEALNTQK